MGNWHFSPYLQSDWQLCDNFCYYWLWLRYFTLKQLGALVCVVVLLALRVCGESWTTKRRVKEAGAEAQQSPTYLSSDRYVEYMAETHLPLLIDMWRTWLRDPLTSPHTDMWRKWLRDPLTSPHTGMWRTWLKDSHLLIQIRGEHGWEIHLPLLTKICGEHGWDTALCLFPLRLILLTRMRLHEVQLHFGPEVLCASFFGTFHNTPKRMFTTQTRKRSNKKQLNDCFTSFQLTFL